METSSRQPAQFRYNRNVFKAASFIYRLLRITLRSPRDLRHVLGIANAAAIQIEDPLSDIRVIPSANIAGLFDCSLRSTFQSFPGVGASITPMESMAIVALCRFVGAKRIFEFGTYKGVSTTQFALNLPDDGQIFTLDLPEDSPMYTLDISVPDERRIAAEAGKGSMIPAECLKLITFLRCDSATFDPEPFRNSIDLAFIDGAHSYEYVVNDTSKAMTMVRSGGVIVWHDFVPSHPGVVRGVKASGLSVQRIDNTTLAFALKP